MDLGIFLQPSHPPEREHAAAYAFDLDVLEWADRFGYTEAWLGEHFTAIWEPVPAPDLLIAAAIARTTTMKLCPGAHLLPFHHPAELAHRIAQLDHMSGGRIMIGIGAGSIATDFGLFGIDASTGVQHEMVEEALSIILKLWTEDGPWVYDGEFWTVAKPPPATAEMPYGSYLRPLQQPHPPFGMAGLSHRSKSLQAAGEKGFIPLSLLFNARYLESHWAAVEEGAARSGRTASRSDWRIVREVLVAETDAEARELAINGTQGRQWTEGNLPFQRQGGFIPFLKHDDGVADDDVDLGYLADHLWLCGSPDTVAARLFENYRAVGGFGTMLVQVYDHVDTADTWKRSMELLPTEVMPRFERLVEKSGMPLY